MTRYPFFRGVAGDGKRPYVPSGICPQCGMGVHISRDSPAINHTAECAYSDRCHGCQYANDTYQSTLLWHGPNWRIDMDALGYCHTPRQYRYYGPRMTFAIWRDTWRKEYHACPQ